MYIYFSELTETPFASLADYAIMFPMSILFHKKTQKVVRVLGGIIALVIMVSMIIAYSGLLSIPSGV